jgi:hypothetical protein
LDGIVKVAEVEIRRQYSQLAYNEQEIIMEVRHWRLDDDTLPADASRDKYWREGPGSPAMWRRLVHVALRFVILSANEADVERLISIRRHLQGNTGTNHRPDANHARLMMHEKRQEQFLMG